MSNNYVSGSMLRKVKTADQYIAMVKDLREDIFDLREAIEYDPDEMARASLIIEPLEKIINELYHSFEDGSYEFKDEDLPYMKIVQENNYTAILPMLHLLKEVNRVHRNGLDID
ncbi:MAG: hypothetical protein KZQ83_13155 [gamma proteobacterium symbiont of Taylorina sp.]|nr:hypothetical protein [gamma proteobacterium symbiont of Taylorina sp.]